MIGNLIDHWNLKTYRYNSEFWDQLKENNRSQARELAQNLTGKSKELDFVSPEFGVQRVDSHEIRQKILSISYVDWKKLGFSKSTLDYMKH